MKNILNRNLFSLLLFIAIPVAVYFVNVEVQSYFGRQAVENTGLKSLSLEKALSKAKAEDKLVLVDVSAIWCGTCRRLDNEVFANEKVRKTINAKFAFVRLEYESPEGTEFLKKHGGRGFPSLWLLDGKGGVVKRLRVVFEPSEFIKQLP